MTRQRDAIVQDLGHAIAIERDRHAQLLQAAEETVEMQIEAEETAVPDMHRVVGGVRVQKSPIQHRNLGLRHRQILAVEEGNAFGIGMRVDMAVAHCRQRL
ncbi:hypothetical protein [Mesorhizobium sp. ESP6-5]|uniref:hypothetical protein n=1 Tax=Mesorhizobium sp. ESP6-5 TaxID=2876623 RepID=UPI0021E2EE9E|nr:hypothetical protein [Mesorhizobium sp. ESP6-5]